jgi:hypothetical protein
VVFSTISSYCAERFHSDIWYYKQKSLPCGLKAEKLFTPKNYLLQFFFVFFERFFEQFFSKMNLSFPSECLLAIGSTCEMEGTYRQGQGGEKSKQ